MTDLLTTRAGTVAGGTDALPAHVPVIIIGAGPVGLLTSLLLSRAGVDNLLLEKRDAVNTLPRARGLNNRSVEILTQLGLGERIRQFSLPVEWSSRFVYTETMAGELIGTMPGSMAPAASEEYSPVGYRVIAQDRLDPLLYEYVLAEPRSQVRFDAEVVDIVDGDEKQTVLVRQGSETTEVTASYVVAADGGSSPTRERLGIPQSYHQTFRSFVAAHFIGDLSRYSRGREGGLIWSLKPGSEGVFHPLDGKLRWVAHIQYDPATENPDSWDEATVVSKVRGMVGVEEQTPLELELVKFYPYTLTAAVADRLRIGRTLLVGDAAHRTLPHGGWGLNTGIQSAHNLAWKLAAVLHGQAGETLLDTYDAERRETALRNCQFALTNAGYVETMMAGLRAMKSAEERREAVAASRQYGNWTGLDLGLHYDGTEGAVAIVPDGTTRPEPENPVIDFIPNAVPGVRAPHMWVRDARNGLRVSLVDVVGLGRFTLLAGPEGEAWLAAARQAASELGLELDAYTVGAQGGLVPETGSFEALYGIEADGAALVRPDGHVAFRARSGGDERSALASALRSIMSR